MSDQGVQINDVGELIDVIELTGIGTIELHATRVPDRIVDLDSMQIGIAQEIQADALIIALRVQVASETADLVTAVQMRYEFQNPDDGPYELPDQVVKTFIEKIAVMAGYPYLRQGISSLSAMLGTPPVTLGLLRAGSISLDDPVEPSAPIDR